MTRPGTDFARASLAATLLLGAASCAPLFDRPKPVEIRPVETPSADGISPDDSAYRSAAKAIDDRDYALALDDLQAARERGPNDVRVLNAFGVVYDKLGRFDLSARYYAQARAIDPHSTIVLANIAYSRALQGLVNGEPPANALANASPPASAAPEPPSEARAPADVNPPSNPPAPTRIAAQPATGIAIPSLRILPSDDVPAQTSQPISSATREAPQIRTNDLAAARSLPVSSALPGAGSASKKVQTESAHTAVEAPIPLPIRVATAGTPVPSPVAQLQTAAPVAAAHDVPQIRADDPPAAHSLSVAIAPPGARSAPEVQAGSAQTAVKTSVPSPTHAAIVVTPVPHPIVQVSSLVAARADWGGPQSSQRVAGKPLLTGHPLVIVNSSGRKGATDSMRRRLVHLGWTAPRWAARDGADTGRSTLFYAQPYSAVARALAHTLRFSVHLASRSCGCGLELVVGKDFLRRITLVDNADSGRGDSGDGREPTSPATSKEERHVPAKI